MPLAPGNVVRRSYPAPPGAQWASPSAPPRSQPFGCYGHARRGVHPKIASEMLGHATVGITLDTYSHVTETMQRTAIRAIEAALAEG
ncbi:integrase family protein [mine drainage metagenome]|uniref:Integrase family protein n=1 Tax=mine drainage metagenome TaxID=410659 RepID=T1BUL6_9ZZZZ